MAWLGLITWMNKEPQSILGMVWTGAQTHNTTHCVQSKNKNVLRPVLWTAQFIILLMVNFFLIVFWWLFLWLFAAICGWVIFTWNTVFCNTKKLIMLRAKSLLCGIAQKNFINIFVLIFLAENSKINNSFVNWDQF